MDGLLLQGLDAEFVNVDVMQRHSCDARSQDERFAYLGDQIGGLGVAVQQKGAVIDTNRADRVASLSRLRACRRTRRLIDKKKQRQAGGARPLGNRGGQAPPSRTSQAWRRGGSRDKRGSGGEHLHFVHFPFHSSLSSTGAVINARKP